PGSRALLDRGRRRAPAALRALGRPVEGAAAANTHVEISISALRSMVMITREDIRELARFQAEGKQECAVSFYFQPRTPQNKSHKEEAILAKELVKNALRETERTGKNGSARADLERVLQL